MSVIIIPAKPFHESKTRLATVLSPAQRAELTRFLLQHTIQVAAEMSQVVVVSRSEAVRQIAGQAGAHPLVEQVADLNAAVRQGVEWTQARGERSALILPLDLPHLSPAALKGLITLGLQQTPSIAIAPCRRNQGTNALFLNPPTLIAPQFGPASFAAHQKAAQVIGVKPKIYHTPDLAFDLDTPEDWQMFVSAGLLAQL